VSAAARAAARHAGALWRGLRAVCGDDAYERYCAHLAARHPERTPPGRRAFYLEEQQRKWRGVSRCC
jgi:uncharacterized short protein YbdD (DUF466 family)